MITKDNNYIRLSNMQKNFSIKHIFASWAIFSLLYWIAAYYKPFHVDEFYSWVYANQCSFKEIFSLRDTGIGHQPLYHIIQKLVQTLFQPYHFLHVRLANYLLGSLFVTIFVKTFLKYRNIPFFCYGVSASSALLDTFVFSRMWGLVCFSSLLLLWVGEAYYKNQDRRFIALILVICALGFLSDFNFVLLVPYVAIILFSRKHYFRYLLPVSLTLMAATWILSEYLYANSIGESIRYVFYNLFNNLTKISYGMGNMLFNYWFEETFLLAMLLFGLSLTFFQKDKNNDIQTKQIAHEHGD